MKSGFTEERRSNTKFRYVLEKIGFDSKKSQNHYIAILALKGVFTEGTVSTNNRNIDGYISLLPSLRKQFSTMLLGKNIKDLSYEELLQLSSDFLDSPILNTVLNNDKDVAVFIKSMDDFILRPKAIVQYKEENNFEDEHYSTSKGNSSVEQQVTDFIFSHYNISEVGELVLDQGQKNIIMFGNAGEFLVSQLNGFQRLVKNNPEAKLNLYYTSNARYLLKAENHQMAEVIISWLERDLVFKGLNDTKDIKQNLFDKLVGVLNSVDDFTRNSNYDELPNILLQEINSVLPSYDLPKVEKWPGETNSILGKDKDLFDKFRISEQVQNEVKKIRDSQYPEAQFKLSKMSTPLMPTVFDYVALNVSKLPNVTLFPYAIALQKSTRNNMPDIKLATTFDELKSYEERGIRGSGISNEANAVQQVLNASSSKSIEGVYYSRLEGNSFDNQAQSIQKGLFGQINDFLRSIERQH